MNIKTTLPISKARQKIFEIAKAVQKPSVYYTLTEKGVPKAVIMSAEEFESWAETLEVAREFPDLKKDIKEMDRDIKSGAYKRYITLDEFVAKNSKYGVSVKAQAKGGKRIRKTS